MSRVRMWRRTQKWCCTNTCLSNLLNSKFRPQNHAGAIHSYHLQLQAKASDAAPLSRLPSAPVINFIGADHSTPFRLTLLSQQKRILDENEKQQVSWYISTDYLQILGTQTSSNHLMRPWLSLMVVPNCSRPESKEPSGNNPKWSRHQSDNRRNYFLKHQFRWRAPYDCDWHSG